MAKLTIMKYTPEELEVKMFISRIDKIESREQYKERNKNFRANVNKVEELNNKYNKKTI